MRFVSRAEWGARYPAAFSPIARRRGVTLHWEGPHMGDFPHRDCARKVRTIERFHKINRGWAGIAYNLLVCPHGYVFEGRGAGMRSAANGTSDIGGNDAWEAVCYLGGQGDGFADAGKAGMRGAIAYLRADGAGPKVNGHRDHHPTECPGDVIYRWLNATDFEEESMSFRLRDLFRYRLYGKKGGRRTFADVLRQISADVAAIRRDVDDIKRSAEGN